MYYAKSSSIVLKLNGQKERVKHAIKLSTVAKSKHETYIIIKNISLLFGNYRRSSQSATGQLLFTNIYQVRRLNEPPDVGFVRRSSPKLNNPVAQWPTHDSPIFFPVTGPYSQKERRRSTTPNGRQVQNVGKKISESEFKQPRDLRIPLLPLYNSPKAKSSNTSFSQRPQKNSCHMYFFAQKSHPTKCTHTGQLGRPGRKKWDWLHA